jgi:hypothetical protein
MAAWTHTCAVPPARPSRAPRLDRRSTRVFGIHPKDRPRQLSGCVHREIGDAWVGNSVGRAVRGMGHTQGGDEMQAAAP